MESLIILDLQFLIMQLNAIAYLTNNICHLIVAFLIDEFMKVFDIINQSFWF